MANPYTSNQQWTQNQMHYEPQQMNQDFDYSPPNGQRQQLDPNAFVDPNSYYGNVQQQPIPNPPPNTAASLHGGFPMSQPNNGQQAQGAMGGASRSEHSTAARPSIDLLLHLIALRPQTSISQVWAQDRGHLPRDPPSIVRRQTSSKPLPHCKASFLKHQGRLSSTRRITTLTREESPYRSGITASPLTLPWKVMRLLRRNKRMQRQSCTYTHCTSISTCLRANPSLFF